MSYDHTYGHKISQKMGNRHIVIQRIHEYATDDPEDYSTIQRTYSSNEIFINAEFYIRTEFNENIEQFFYGYNYNKIHFTEKSFGGKRFGVDSFGIYMCGGADNTEHKFTKTVNVE